MMRKLNCIRNGVRIGLVATLLSSSAVLGLQPALAASDAGWKPSISERLVKLPSANIKKALDKDFSSSPLADALRDTDAEIALKLQTLRDLQAAVDQAEGDIQFELKHQFLAEKREYLSIVQEQHKMRGKHLKTRIKVYQRLLNKIERDAAAKSPGQSALVEKQTAARARFERSAEIIDTKLFATSLSADSKYSKQYAANVSAINALAAKIEAHPHKAKLDVTGDAKTKPDFLRQLLTEAEGDYQVLQQESEIVGLMAKLVALDAMGLQEAVAESEDLPQETLGNAKIADAVNLF
ncbi:MAG: hypothetical protein CMM59_15295 [Rhodospirillaceae bacterium]|nr:hypothetical protein [Rhodospirillaceae bacterium]